MQYIHADFIPCTHTLSIIVYVSDQSVDSSSVDLMDQASQNSCHSQRALVTTSSNQLQNAKPFLTSRLEDLATRNYHNSDSSSKKRKDKQVTILLDVVRSANTAQQKRHGHTCCSRQRIMDTCIHTRMQIYTYTAHHTQFAC